MFVLSTGVTKGRKLMVKTGEMSHHGSSECLVLLKQSISVLRSPPRFCRECGTCACAVLFQSCPTLCNPMHYSLLGFYVHGILQARILEWIAILFSSRSSIPRDQILVFCIIGRFFTI